MDVLVPGLKKSVLTDCMSRDTLENIIIPAGIVRTFPKDSAVFQIDDRISDIRVLLSGKVNLCCYSQDGIRDLQDNLQPPEIVGLDLICTRTKISPYMAVAAEDSSIFSFPSEYILSAGLIPEAERLECIGKLLTLLSHSSMKKEYRIAILTQSGLRDRIMTYLTMQAGRQHTKTFKIPFNRDEMASYLSVNRSALSHELSRLKQEGIIDFHRNEFRLFSV